jgi:hypothetical protein
MARKRQQPIEHPSSKLSDRTPITRAAHDRDNPYFLMRRDTAQDSSLSFEARGVLSYLLSKPDDWKVYVGDLRREGNIGKDQIQRILKELEIARYLTRKKCRDRLGQWDWQCLVNEKPMLSPQPGFPAMDNPATGKPATENPAIYKIQTKETTDEENTDTTAAAVCARSLSSSSTSRESGARARAATTTKQIALSRYTKKEIRLYVDGMKKARNPGGLTHTLWLSGDADEDVAEYLRHHECWQKQASKKAIEIALEGWPHWSNDKNWKGWEPRITATVVGYFELWERALEEIRQRQISPFPMEDALQTYVTLVASEIGRASSNAA